MRDFIAGVIRDAYLSIKAWPLWKKILVAALIIIAAYIVVTYRPTTTGLRALADQYGDWFYILYFFIYIVVTQLPIPRTVCTLTSGILFGPVKGFALVICATTISAAISFSIVRLLLGDWMAPRLRHPAVAGINERLAKRGWLAIISLRMIAAVPFSILNYVAALSSVRLLPFVIATAIGSAPGSLATVFLGDSMTGTFNPIMMGISLVLFLCGISGLVADKKLEVK
ncbi:MAG: TVP38/TMEM64 family protein [Corynebacterium sp.]|nr:TVP38/TMEM64 family protein [Corynebacterium sp.]